MSRNNNLFNNNNQIDRNNRNNNRNNNNRNNVITNNDENDEIYMQILQRSLEEYQLDNNKKEDVRIKREANELINNIEQYYNNLGIKKECDICCNETKCLSCSNNNCGKFYCIECISRICCSFNKCSFCQCDININDIINYAKMKNDMNNRKKIKYSGTKNYNDNSLDYASNEILNNKDYWNDIANNLNNLNNQL